MPRPAAFDLLPLLLTEAGGRLVIRGSHPALRDMVWEGWDEVVHAGSGGASDRGLTALSHGARALLHVDTSPLPVFARGGTVAEVAAASICRGGPARSRALKRGGEVRDGVPVLGRPLVWLAARGGSRGIEEASPRGRLDEARLATHGLTRVLRPLGFGWSVSTDPRRSIVSRFLAQVGMRSSCWELTRTHHLVIKNATHFLKIRIQPTAAGQFTKAWNRIDPIRRTMQSSGLDRYVAGGRRELRVGGHAAGLEDRLPGQSAFKLLGAPTRLSRVYDAAIAFLERWYGGDGEGQPVTPDFFSRHWLEPLDPLARFLQAEGHGELWEQLRAGLRERVLGRTIRPVPVHGDFWLNNLLVDRSSQLTGVVDWDRASVESLPLLDLFQLLCWRTSRFRRDFAAAHIRHYMGDASTASLDLIRRHCARISLSRDWIPDLFCRYWLGSIADHIDQLENHDPARLGLLAIRDRLRRVTD